MKFVVFLFAILTPIVSESRDPRYMMVRDHGDGVIRQYNYGDVLDQKALEAAADRYGESLFWIIYHPVHTKPSVVPKLKAAGFWNFEFQALPRTWWIQNQWNMDRRRTQWVGVCLLFLVGFLIWFCRHLWLHRKQRPEFAGD